jgi:dipeptidyl aminopeptidase/acylaminoacyl peptidase
VGFPARGNDVAISAWYIPHEGSRKALILVHGKDNNRVAEFDVHFVDFAASLHGRGFTVLMIDLRGHGLGGEGHVSWGMNERRDIEAAVDWLKLQGIRTGSVGVLGVSLGAASCIFAAADDPDIGAVVADSGYAN